MNNNILRAEVKIVGTRVALWNWFGPDAIPLEKKERVGVAGNNPSEWRSTCLVTKQGQLFFEPSYAFSSIRNGARFTAKKRGNYMADVSATLQVVTPRILVDRWFPGWPKEGGIFNPMTAEEPARDSELPVYLDVRSVVNPATKARNVRYRLAAAPGWSATFEVEWDKTIVDRSIMQACIIDAGRLVGIGNGRTIGFGRFILDSFEIIESM